MPSPLTDTERRILDYMVRYLRTHTFQPSIREIGEEFGIKSTKTVSEYLRALADKGYLERNSSRSRAVRILGEDLSAQGISVPCYREVPGNGTAPRSNSAEAHFVLDRRLAGAKGSFMIRVRGDELAVLGAAAGDYVLIEPLTHAGIRDGDLALVRIDGRPGFYRVTRTERGTLLKALQGGADPVELRDDPASEGDSAARPTVTLIGRATALHRRLDGSPLTMSPTAH